MSGSEMLEWSLLLCEEDLPVLAPPPAPGGDDDLHARLSRMFPRRPR